MRHSTSGVFIIAGASKGLGRQLACTAYENGYSLALIARSKSELDKLKKELSSKNSKQTISVHEVDLTDEEKTIECFNEIAAVHKKVSVLVNCAAIWTGGKSVKELSSQDMQKSLMLNFFSAFHTIKALLGLQNKSMNKPMAIINVGATASLRGGKNMAAFAVAKGALRQLSQSLARELGPEKIHVAHLIIDGVIANQRTKSLNPNRADEKFIEMPAIAKSILQVIEQESSAWTFEWDIRPFNETW